jgi:hypothetical protein
VPATTSRSEARLTLAFRTHAAEVRLVLLLDDAERFSHLCLGRQFTAGAPRLMQPFSATERLRFGSMPQAVKLTDRCSGRPAAAAESIIVRCHERRGLQRHRHRCPRDRLLHSSRCGLPETWRNAKKALSARDRFKVVGHHPRFWRFSRS